MIIFPCNLVSQLWNSGNQTSAGNTNLGNSPFTLYLMNAATGFTNTGQGVRHYIDICKQHDLLPIGCGHVFNCDMKRPFAEPCLPMPESRGCQMLLQLSTNTGWHNNIVAFQHRRLMLSTPNGEPNENQSLRAVCGKLAGILWIISFEFYRYKTNIFLLNSVFLIIFFTFEYILRFPLLTLLSN